MGTRAETVEKMKTAATREEPITGDVESTVLPGDTENDGLANWPDTISETEWDSGAIGVPRDDVKAAVLEILRSAFPGAVSEPFLLKRVRENVRDPPVLRGDFKRALEWLIHNLYRDQRVAFRWVFHHGRHRFNGPLRNRRFYRLLPYGK